MYRPYRYCIYTNITYHPLYTTPSAFAVTVVSHKVTPFKKTSVTVTHHLVSHTTTILYRAHVAHKKTDFRCTTHVEREGKTKLWREAPQPLKPGRAPKRAVKPGPPAEGSAAEGSAAVKAAKIRTHVRAIISR